MVYLKEIVNIAETKYDIVGISAGQDILGVEGEFNDALAQFSSSARIIEDFPEDSRREDSKATPLNIFGKNLKKG